MSQLRILTLGIGDAFSARWYSSCFAVEYAGHWLLVDCPHPIRKLMREAALNAQVELDIGHIGAVVLTHQHADHASGLEGFGFYNRFLLGRRTRLLMHPSVGAGLWPENLAGGMRWVVQGRDEAPLERTFADFFDSTELSETVPVEVGPFSIVCRPTVHSVPTTALFITAGGRTLGYSADTAFDPQLLEWLAPADLIVHESNPGLLHSPFEQLAALPAALRAKMRVIHCPDSFDIEAVHAIEPLRQGRLYVV